MTHSDTHRCSGGCPSCPAAESDEGLEAWRAAHDSAVGAELGGVRLLVRAAAAFAVPTLGALVGVVTVGGGETRRFAGLIAGLAAGVVVSLVLGRRLRPRPAPSTCGKRPAGTKVAAVEESV